MKKYYFIHENSHIPKIKTFAFLLVALLVLLFTALFFSRITFIIYETIPFSHSIIQGIKQDVIHITPAGLFYAHFIGGIFFVPSPDEAIFYFGLLQGNPLFISFCAAITGYMLAQVLNYFLGIKMSSSILHFISKRKLYKARRSVTKYGAYAIFFANVLPLPAPLLTFALGIAKYNRYRLFTITLLGKCVKYIIIILLFILIN